MTTRQRGVVMVVIAALGVASSAALAIAMRRTRATQREVYGRDREWLRKRAGATRPPAPAEAGPAVSRTHCVSGVDGFMSAVVRAMVDVPRPKAGAEVDRAARLALLTQASAWAVRAEKNAELDRPAPTLPQRMGSEAVPGGAPHERQPITPPRAACEGKGFASFPDYRPPSEQTKPGAASKPAGGAAAGTTPGAGDATMPGATKPGATKPATTKPGATKPLRKSTKPKPAQPKPDPLD